MIISETTPGASILVVDDEIAISRTLTLMLGRAGYQVVSARDIDTARQLLNERSIDLVLVDLRLGEENGLDLIRLIKQSYPEVESILLTAYGSIENTVEAMQAGAGDYVTKPFSEDEFLIRVNRVLERRLMRRELVSLRQHIAMNYGFDNIVGISKQLLHVKETARRVSPTDITVLITGASGTGKELFAKAIHHHSERRERPFVAVDCSAIPEALLESELFGHTKGSFTSAITDKKGLFEQADGGTLFLDEVGNMPPNVQVKLLRFIQDSVVRRVGSEVSRRIDVRIVAATNRDLAGLVAEGRFRDDLYYRLNVIPLVLPTLKERAEDVEILTDYFLRRTAQEMDKGPLTISRDAVNKLQGHSWPGNIRELENTLKRAAALCTSRHLEAHDITFIASDEQSQQPTGPTRVSLHLKGKLLDDSQRSLIVRALNDNNWNYTKTADDLGIGRTTLWRKIKKYDLKKELVTS